MASGGKTKEEKALEKALKKAKDELAKVKAIAKKEAQYSAEIRAEISRALELLDNCAVALERDDENFMAQTAGAAREFLDKLAPEMQALFREWHEPGAEQFKSRLG
jgi:hypothetical protein